MYLYVKIQSLLQISQDWYFEEKRMAKMQLRAKREMYLFKKWLTVKGARD